MICERDITKSTLWTASVSKNFTSQNGEDGILEFIFSKIYENNSDRYCIDVGAWDGQHLSNTYHLVKNLGWSGCLIEARYERYLELSHLYHDRTDVLCINQVVEIDGQNSLFNCLIESQVPLEPSFICIDIDGADYHLWKSVGHVFRADVVCIEFNPTIPNHVRYVQGADSKIHKGSSLLALKELGESLGYKLIATTTFNGIFLREDLLRKFPFPPCASLDGFHFPSMTTDIFQTYDGELIFLGTKKLLWHNIGLNTQQLQMLKSRDQKYPFSPTSVEKAAIDHIEDQLIREIKHMSQPICGQIEIKSLISNLLGDLSLYFQIPCYRGVVVHIIEKIFLRISLESNGYNGTIDVLEILFEFTIRLSDLSSQIDQQMSLRLLLSFLTVIEFVERKWDQNLSKFKILLYLELTLTHFRQKDILSTIFWAESLIELYHEGLVDDSTAKKVERHLKKVNHFISSYGIKSHNQLELNSSVRRNKNSHRGVVIGTIFLLFSISFVKLR